MVLHYFTPWYYLYLVKLHALFCHESWDSDSGENVYEDKSGSYVSWFYDAFLKEIQDAWYWTSLVFVYFFMHHFNGGPVNYFFFERWNISEMDEIIIEAQKVVKLYSQTPVSVSVCDFIGCKNEATNVLIIRNEYYCDKHS